MQLPSCKVFRRVSTNDTNAVLIKATPGIVYGGFVSNIATYQITVRLYNQKSVPTVGTDVPYATYVLEPAQSTPLNIPDGGIVFDQGIALGMSKFEQDNDSTAVGANDGVVDIYWD